MNFYSFQLSHIFEAMIKTVIFDMDGVIIDSEPVHQELEWEMYRELDLKITEDEHRNYVGTSAIDMWTMIREKHPLSKTPDELLVYGREQYWKALEKGRVPLVDGCLPLLELLSQSEFIIQVASSATRPTVDKVLAHFGIGSYFSHRIGGNEVTRSKPDPEIFLRAASQSSTPPEQCLVIEDSANGVKAAKAAGMVCIGYANPGTGNQDLSAADLVVDSLHKIDLNLVRSIAD